MDSWLDETKSSPDDESVCVIYDGGRANASSIASSSHLSLLPLRSTAPSIRSVSAYRVGDAAPPRSIAGSGSVAGSVVGGTILPSDEGSDIDEVETSGVIRARNLLSGPPHPPPVVMSMAKCLSWKYIYENLPVALLPNYMFTSTIGLLRHEEIFHKGLRLASSGPGRYPILRCSRPGLWGDTLLGGSHSGCAKDTICIDGIRFSSCSGPHLFNSCNLCVLHFTVGLFGMSRSLCSYCSCAVSTACVEAYFVLLRISY